jgi:hypothetical protein
MLNNNQAYKPIYSVVNKICALLEYQGVFYGCINISLMYNTVIGS